MKFLPAPAEPLLMAGGMTKLVVALPKSGKIVRWNLLTFEREATADLPLRDARAVSMGYASDGPIFLCAGGGDDLGKRLFVDLETLQPLGRTTTLPISLGKKVASRAAGDGLTFTVANVAVN